MAETGTVVEIKTIWIEAIGTRKAIGAIEFIPNPKFVGDVAEMEYDAAHTLLRGESVRENGGLLPAFREAVLKDYPKPEPVVESVVESEPTSVKRMGRPPRK